MAHGPVTIFGLPRHSGYVAMEAVRRQMWLDQDLIKKFDIVLAAPEQREDQTGTTKGCFSAAAQSFKKEKLPIFRAGGVINGHFILRPRKSITITDLELIFGGQHSVSWSSWTGSEDVFNQRHSLGDLQTFNLCLEALPYKFDFTFTLPDFLPPSVQGPVCKYQHVYFVFGKVSTAETVVQTVDTAFDVETTLDIGRVPSVLHGPLVWPQSLVFPMGTNLEETGVVSAKMCLNKRAFVYGDHALVDITVDNGVDSPLVCKLRFHKVVTCTATQAIPRHRGPRAKVLEAISDVGSGVNFKVDGHSTESFSKMFDIACDTPSFLRKCPEHRQDLRTLENTVMPASIHYRMELEVCHKLTKKSQTIRLPVVIGTEDGGQRLDIRQSNPQLLYVDFLGSCYYNRTEVPPPCVRHQQSHGFTDVPPPRYEDCVKTT